MPRVFPLKIDSASVTAWTHSVLGAALNGFFLSQASTTHDVAPNKVAGGNV